MKAYLDIANRVLSEGEIKEGRNGKTWSITGEMFRHNMRKGFPILTCREMSLKNAITETRFFIQGLSSKSWLKERGNNFWNKWCNREAEDYTILVVDHGPSKAAEMTDDLGPIYGVQWRDFNGEGVDQLKWVIDTLKINPKDRRMLVSAWNPIQMKYMALPPCHDSFQLISNGKDLDLIWRQRSCDVAVGLPYDIILYGILLELIAKEVNMTPRWLIGQLGDTHVYQENLDQLVQVCERTPKLLPELFFTHTVNIFDWALSDIESSKWSLVNYKPHSRVKFNVVA